MNRMLLFTVMLLWNSLVDEVMGDNTPSFLVQGNTVSSQLDNKITDITVESIFELDAASRPVGASSHLPFFHFEDLSIKELEIQTITHDTQFQQLRASIAGLIVHKDEEFQVDRGTIFLSHSVSHWPFCKIEGTELHDCKGEEGVLLDVNVVVEKRRLSARTSSWYEIEWADDSKVLIGDMCSPPLIDTLKLNHRVPLALRASHHERFMQEDFIIANEKNNSTNQSRNSDNDEPDVAGGWTTVIVCSVVGGILLAGIVTQILVEFYCPRRAIDKEALEFTDVRLHAVETGNANK